MNSFQLITPRARLELLVESDFAEILDLFQEPDTFRFIPHLQNKTAEEYRKVLTNRLNQIASGSALHWTARTTSGELIGVLNYSPIGETSRMQLGFQIRMKFQGQGYATELAGAVVHYLRRNKSGNVFGICSREHLASATVLQRIGFMPTDEVTYPNDDIRAFVMHLNLPV